MLAQIDDQSAAERLAGHAGAGPAGDQRHLMFAGVAHQRLHVLLVARHDDAGRPHLEDGGVGAVQHAVKIVEQQLALDDALEVVADAFALRRVHGNHPFNCSRRRRSCR